MEDGNGQVTFMFQVGLVRDFVTTDASQLTLKTLKDLACNFINQRVSPILLAVRLARFGVRVFLLSVSLFSLGFSYYSPLSISLSVPAPTIHCPARRIVPPVINQVSSGHEAVAPQFVLMTTKGSSRFHYSPRSQTSTKANEGNICES